MAYVINESCINCGACADVCPVDAITMDDTIYTINKDKCICCGQCITECPVESIEPEGPDVN